MAITKNKGPLLVSLFRGAIEQLPLEWRAKLGLKQTVQENPTDVEPDDLTGVRIESQTTQERTNERKKTNIEIAGDITETLVEQRRLPNGQIANVVRRLLPEGTALSVDPTAVEGTQRNLGIGYVDQSVVDAELPGPTIYDTRVDRDGVVISQAKTRKLISTITEGEFILGGIWTRIYREGETGLVATEVVESRPIETT
jgi:hypothetical protein